MILRVVHARESRKAMSILSGAGLLFSMLFLGGQSVLAVGETCNGLPATQVGTSGVDLMEGTTGNDVIVALGGIDTIHGNGGNDTVCAGDGNDVVVTGSGNDWVDGGNQNDNIDVGDGHDTVFGGSGNDHIEGGDGNDVIYGENNDDNIDGGDGDDEIHGGNNEDTIEGGDGDDRLFGDNHADTIDGGNGNDLCDLGANGLLSIRCEATGAGIITIIKDAIPDGAQDFNFTGGLGAFSLDDDADGTLPASIVFNKPAGSYGVQESALPAGWSLVDITCSDAESVIDEGNASVLIDLDNGESVTCTFVNEQSVCGDGVDSTGEECDDGNVTPGDGCDAVCHVEFCGDGSINDSGTEQCDDGNAASGDGCTAACLDEFCGDAVTNDNGSEQCDNGAGNSDTLPNACRSDCQNAVCGDGVQDNGEVCDDGNQDNGDGCTNTCTVSSCGNGVTEGGEECDDGNQNNEDSCLNQCLLPYCGDGQVRDGEDCDDGNIGNADGCSSSCEEEDGFDCDDDDGGPSVCESECGDGLRVGAEECDDDNDDDGDGCSALCEEEEGYICQEPNAGAPSVCATQCGDGKVTSVEQCDDGNTANGDGCSNTCAEESGWTCSETALPPAALPGPSSCSTICNDGVLTGPEQCEDGNVAPGDGCSATCRFETSSSSVSSAGSSEGASSDGGASEGSASSAASGGGTSSAGSTEVSGLSVPDRNPGEGKTRGHETHVLNAAANELFSRRFANGDVAPGAFGGGDDIPLTAGEKDLLCSMQRALPRFADGIILDWLSGHIGNLLSREPAMIREALLDIDLCSDYTAYRPSLYGFDAVPKLPERPAKPIWVASDGLPWSKTNDLWNLCVRNPRLVTVADIRANPDRDDRGRPLTCSDYAFDVPPGQGRVLERKLVRDSDT
ncbi:DUF4215 domain-containing protein [Candidatus Peregrinibacteria bacterium]|nr:DUF4215 domain-containing protein [Candidatus Peregrinibacteria bacterium]